MKKLTCAVLILILTLLLAFTGCGGGNSKGKGNDNGGGEETPKTPETPVYTVTYDGNGNTSGTVPVDSNTYKTGDTVTVLDATEDLKNDWKSFYLWNTQPDGSGTDYWPGSTFTMGTSNVILYARFSCFAAGTLVSTPRGFVKIEDLVINDTVYSYDLEQKTIVEAKVTKTFMYTVDQIYTVKVDSDTIKVTGEHP